MGVQTKYYIVAASALPEDLAGTFWKDWQKKAAGLVFSGGMVYNE